MNSFSAIVWKEGDTFVSRLDGTNISSCGETVEEAVNNLKEALELYFEEMSDDEKQEIIESAQDSPGNKEKIQSVSFSMGQ